MEVEVVALAWAALVEAEEWDAKAILELCNGESGLEDADD